MVKMTKLAMKILYVVLIFTMMLSLMAPVFAFTSPSAVTPDTNSQNTFDTQLGAILGVVQGVGIGVAVIILVVVGIRYMMGSAEEKAEYKKTMIPYVVGAVLIGGATTIANAVYNFGKTMSGTPTPTP